MSELKDSEGLGQGFPYASANEVQDAEVEQEGLDHSSGNPVFIGQSEVMNAQVHFSGNSNFEEAPPKPLSETPSGEADGSVGSEEEEKDMLPSNEVVNVQANTEAGSGDVGCENVEEIMEMNDRVNDAEVGQAEENHTTELSLTAEKAGRENLVNMEGTNQSFPFNSQSYEGNESGTEGEQAEFMKELENFFKERKMEFKPPKFYGEGLNCLKLWRAVTKLGGYDTVTSCKLWRQVGESFKPPKTCTTVSWSFRIFYEKALLDYERHKVHGGELCVPTATPAEPVGVGNQVGSIQASGSGRARRDAAARAMQGWHSQRLLGNGEVGDPIIKDKSSVSIPKREKHLKSLGVLKRKKPSSLERAVKAARTKVIKQQLRSLDTDGQVSLSASRMDTMVVDVGPTADWVKINVRRTRDCFEIYALVPGLLREEVRVQSDPAGRLVISGEPEQLDNPWGVTPFKKVISLPSRIDPHQTSAVVTLHGQLFVRAPYEQSDL